MPFKMHNIIYFFPEKKYACLLYLKYSDTYPKHTFFIWPKSLFKSSLESLLSKFSNTKFQKVKVTDFEIKCFRFKLC